MLAKEDASSTDNVPLTPTEQAASGRQSLVAVAGFFALKAVIGFLILAISAKKLAVTDFATFSQLFLYLALLGSVAAAGVQNGVIREVAAAKGELRTEQLFVLGSIAVWVCFAVICATSVFLFRNTIAIILIGSTHLAGTIVLLTIAALLTGLGTLLCSALSGSGRAPVSLFIQGVGLVVGGGLCLTRLQAGDAVGAVLFYATGPLCTVFLALWASRRWLHTTGIHWAAIINVARGLLSYSATFLVVASALPFVLFGVRYVYRLDFGPVWLGYWLMANRASDVTTQVIGLYLSQVFLPHVTRSGSGEVRLREIRRTLALGVAVAGTGAAVFAIGSSWIISFVLSDRYLAALPFILGYLAGDMFRVGGNVALYTVLAARKLVLFMAIEVGLALLVGVSILIGIALGYPSAAYWGYFCAHAVAFIAVLLLTRRLAFL